MVTLDGLACSTDKGFTKDLLLPAFFRIHAVLSRYHKEGQRVYFITHKGGERGPAPPGVCLIHRRARKKNVEG